MPSPQERGVINMMPVAIILAAGLSSRMDVGFKPLLLLPQSDSSNVCALEMLVRTYKDSGVENIFVVTGHRADEVKAVATRLGVEQVQNHDFASGMFSSVCAGLQIAKGTHAFVHPVDIPLVRPMTIKTLLSCASEDKANVLIPSFQGNDGHPPLIPACHHEHILRWAGKNGLQGALQQLPVRNISVADSLMLYDMDTDEDYAKICSMAGQRDVLSPSEAEEMLGILRIHERGVDHAVAVSKLARALAEELNRTGKYALAPDIAESAGLLHDICKGQAQHEAAAGKLLRSLELPIMAKLVENHRDCEVPQNGQLTERELLYLADKYMQCDRLVNLAERFEQKMHQYASNTEAVTAIKGRLQRAMDMEKHFTAITNISPYAIAKNLNIIPKPCKR